VNLYELLGVDASAEAAELARAYRRRLRQLHPDVRHSIATDADRLERPADLAAVQHAYQVLRDPDRRARYDAELRARTADQPARRRASTPVPITVRVHRTPRRAPLMKVGRVRIDPLPSYGDH
jgi:curved DNA-binding protein CbpA